MTNLKTRTTNLNKITRARRPLATARGIPRLALTALLTLAPLGLALGAVTVAPGTAWAASACSGTSPFANLGPLSAWIYSAPTSPGGMASVTLVYGSVQEGLPLDSNYVSNHDFSSIDQSWSGLDNPGPLEWYYSHESTDIGCVEFGQGITYTSSLITTMNSERFSPSVIGGVNPPGVNAPTTQTTTPAQATSPSSTPSKSPTVTSPTTTPPPTQTPPTTVQSKTPQTPITPIAVTTPPPGAQSHELEIIQQDRHLISVGSPPQIPPQHHSIPWGDIVIGVLGALIVAVVVTVVHRARQPRTTDDVNRTLGGRRDF